MSAGWSAEPVHAEPVGCDQSDLHRLLRAALGSTGREYGRRSVLSACSAGGAAIGVGGGGVGACFSLLTGWVVGQICFVSLWFASHSLSSRSPCRGSLLACGPARWAADGSLGGWQNHLPATVMTTPIPVVTATAPACSGASSSAYPVVHAVQVAVTPVAAASAVLAAVATVAVTPVTTAAGTPVSSMAAVSLSTTPASRRASTFSIDLSSIDATLRQSNVSELE